MLREYTKYESMLEGTRIATPSFSPPSRTCLMYWYPRCGNKLAVYSGGPVKAMSLVCFVFFTITTTTVPCDMISFHRQTTFDTPPAAKSRHAQPTEHAVVFHARPSDTVAKNNNEDGYSTPHTASTRTQNRVPPPPMSLLLLCLRAVLILPRGSRSQVLRFTSTRIGLHPLDRHIPFLRAVVNRLETNTDWRMGNPHDE